MAVTITVSKEGIQFSGRSLQPTKEKNALLAPLGKVLHLYGLVLELLPEENQETFFRKSCGCTRLVHNDYIAEKGRVYREEHRAMPLSEYKAGRLKALKEEKAFLREADKFALESGAENAENAFQNFFEGRAGYPRFVSRRKPNGNRYTTKQTNGNIRLLVDGGCPYVKLPKAGLVRFILPKGKTLPDILPDGVRITKATVSLRDGRSFVSLSLEDIIDLADPAAVLPAKSLMAGDAGLKEFMVYGTMDNTVHVENPRFIRLHEKRLRRFQKKLSRRQYDKNTHTGSKNWEKARAMVSKEHLKTANQRKDFQHKLSRKIADACRVFVCEDLNIRGMMKNRRLARSIASVGWYSFFEKLKYKLERKGGQLLKAGRWFASSQECSSCGYKNQEVKDLSVRRWVCPRCGTVHDRDENAKENLLKEGIRILSSQGVRVTGIPDTLSMAS